eukprot:4321412-Amphidinium_carterae.1
MAGGTFQPARLRFITWKLVHWPSMLDTCATTRFCVHLSTLDMQAAALARSCGLNFWSRWAAGLVRCLYSAPVPGTQSELFPRLGQQEFKDSIDKTDLEYVAQTDLSRQPRQHICLTEETRSKVLNPRG